MSFLRLLTIVSMTIPWLRLECAFRCVKATFLQMPAHYVLCMWTLATLKIKCVGRHCEPLQAVLCAAPIRAHPIAALPVLVAQLHEPEAILHAPDWLFLHTRYEHSVAALPDLQILVLWFQQVLQGQPCLMPFSTLCLVVAFDCLRVSKLKSLT